MADEDDIEEGEEIDNAAELSNINKRMRRIRRSATEDRRFWEAVMSQPRGRAAIWRVMSVLGTFSLYTGVTPTGYPSNPLTWYNLGRKEFGRELWTSLVEIDPEAVVLMHKEATKAVKKKEDPNG